MQLSTSISSYPSGLQETKEKAASVSNDIIIKNDEFQGITGSLRIENGSSYTWSVKAFKRWKKQFRLLFFKKYGYGLNEAIPDPNQREILYKSLLGMDGYDVFQTGNVSNQLHIEATLLNTCTTVAVLLR